MTLRNSQRTLNVVNTIMFLALVALLVSAAVSLWREQWAHSAVFGFLLFLVSRFNSVIPTDAKDL